MSDPKIDAVQRIYEAYGRGDIEAVLAEVSDDVDWAPVAASTSAPWYGSHPSKGNVPRFFKEIGTSIEVTEFTPLSFTSNETEVIAATHWSFKVIATGSRAVCSAA